jgi:hypothetical protein
MNKSELSALDQLREDLHAYHVDVQTNIARCEGCKAEVQKMSLDLYGIPGEKEKGLGLLATVQDLCRSRRLMLWGMRGIWTLASGAVVGLLVAFIRSCF